MKKMLSLLLVLFMISCASDDSPAIAPPTFDVDKLLRGWSYDQYAVDGAFYAYAHQEGCNKDYFGFRNRPGQQFQFEEVIFIDSNCALTQTMMEWKAVGNAVELYFGEFYVGKLIILELSDTNLNFILQADVDGDGTIEEQEIKSIPYDPYESF